MALNGLFCADVPLRNYSLTHLLIHQSVMIIEQNLMSFDMDTNVDPSKIVLDSENGYQSPTGRFGLWNPQS